MTKEKVSSDAANGQQGDSSDKSPYESVVVQVVSKIKNEPFLFVIGVAALLVGLATFPTQLGSSDFRIIVIVIASLSFVVIVGYYLKGALSQPTKKSKNQEPKTPPIFVESKTFVDLSTFSQKKELFIQPFQSRIEKRTIKSSFVSQYA